jgi:hypothetical protein
VTDIHVPSTSSGYHIAEGLKKNHHFLKAGRMNEPQEKEAVLEVKYLPRVLSGMSWRRKNQRSPKSTKTGKRKSSLPIRKRNVK